MEDLHFSEAEIQRYARHILLPEIGGTGQAALRRARVLIVGAGGLGCPALLYLAAAGIGTIGVVDDDRVDLSNLQRQVAFGMPDIGAPKVAAALAAARRINPLATLVPHENRLTAQNATALIAGYDVVCDGSDNFTTRAAVAEACRRAGITLVTAAVTRFEGQLAVFPPDAGTADVPCYRCLYPEPPPLDAGSCADAGVLGPAAGVMGTLQAVEVLKTILGVGETLTGRLLIWEALTMRFHTIVLARDAACPVCHEDGPAGTDTVLFHAHDTAPI